MSDASQLSRGKRIAFGVIAVVLFTTLPIFLMEGCASGYLFARDGLNARAPRTLLRPHTVHDSLLGWSNAPGYAKPNEFGDDGALTITPQGFRAGGVMPSGGSGASRGVRIVCSGDSFTFGVGVGDAEHWCARLGHELGGAETVNLAVPAYGLDQSVLRYQRDGVPLAPRVHLLAITDASLERSLDGSDKGWFKPYLALEGGALRTRNVPVPPQEAGPLRHAAAGRAFDELRLVQLARRLRGVDAVQESAAAVDERTPLFQRMLQELGGADRSRGTALVLCYLPTARAARSNGGAERRRRLAALARAQDLPFIDLTPRMGAMRADSLDLAFILPTTPRAPQGVTGQYSRLGNHWVARTLARELEALPALVADPGTAPSVPGRLARSSNSH